MLRQRWAGMLACLLVLVLVAGCTGDGGSPSPEPSPTGSPSPTNALPDPRPRDDRPNIVVVMADDMRADDLVFAPNLRRIVARNGVTFNNSFSSYPLCCPARASFMTGEYAHNHGVLATSEPYGYGAFDDSRTIATALQASGYQTGFIGKYLNGYGKMDSKVKGGPSYNFQPPGWSDWRAAFENPGNVEGIDGSTYRYYYTPYNINGVVDMSHRGEYQSRTLGGFSMDMARGFSEADRPFFMYVNYVAPHKGIPREGDDPEDLVRPDGSYESFATPARPHWVRGWFDSLVDGPQGMPRDGSPSEQDMRDKSALMRMRPQITESERRRLTQVTRQRGESIYVMDQQIRRLVVKLKNLGEWKDTVFMFTSDNGFFQGEHRMRMGKIWSHEPSLRVPLLVTGPGLRKRSERNDRVSTVDIPRTIIDLARAKEPVTQDGLSLRRTLYRGDQGWDVPVVTENVGTSVGPPQEPGDIRSQVGLRTWRYSYMEYSDGERELYDMLRDPLQMDSVAKSPRYRPVLRRLARVLDRTRDCAGQECRDKLPVSLRGTPKQVDRVTERYWKAIETTYGYEWKLDGIDPSQPDDLAPELPEPKEFPGQLDGVGDQKYQDRMERERRRAENRRAGR